MSSWGTKRRNFIITIFLSTVFIILATTGYVLFYEKPNCFDGRKNGNELDVDCGGSCKLLCTNQAIEPLIKWNRYFEVVPGIYNVVAYLENQNSDAGTKRLEYKFTLFDRNNAILDERISSIEVRPNEIIPIVENALNTGSLKPSRMTFEITNELVWERREPRELVIRTKDDQLTQVNGEPRVSSIIENTGFNTVSDFEIVVILYNSDDNAIGVSSTYVEQILANKTQNITFTWPQNFVGEVARFEIIPLYETE